MTDTGRKVDDTTQPAERAEAGGKSAKESEREQQRSQDGKRTRPPRRDGDVPRSESVVQLLLAREGDRITLGERTPPLDLVAIVRERDLAGKRVQLVGAANESFVAWRADEEVRVRNEDSGEEFATETFRVVGRELGLTEEGWQNREQAIAAERYREVRVDSRARSAIVAVLGWFATTWGIDEDVGNGTWRQRRDDLLATAYRLDQKETLDDSKSDSGPGLGPRSSSFTLETVERDLLDEAISNAREDADNPFGTSVLDALKRQIKFPEYREYEQ